MKNLTIILFLAVCIVLIAFSVLFKMYIAQKSELAESKQAIVLSQQETEYYKLANGQVMASVKSLESSLNIFKLSVGSDIANLEKKFGPIKHLQNYISAGIKSAGTIYTNVKDTMISDTIRAKKFDFTDNYLSLNCVMVNDSVNCPYSYADSLEVAIVLNRNWKWYQPLRKYKLKKQGFAKWTPITKVVFSNPNSKAVGLKSYIVK